MLIQRWQAVLTFIKIMLRLCFICWIIGHSTSVFALSKPSSDPYDDCVRGFELGAGDSEIVTISPINATCSNICEQSCTSLLSRNNAVGLEINSAPIQECIQQCRNGVQFKGSYFELIGGNLVAKGPAESAVRCYGGLSTLQDQAQTKMRLATGERFKLRIIDSEDASKVSMCGRKAVSLIPIVNSLNSAVWTSTSTPPNTSKTSSLCSYDIPIDSWNASSVSSLLSARTDNGICSWHARNNLFSNTGIYVQNGDEMTIAWSSTLVYNPSYIPNPTVNDASRRTIYQLSQDTSLSSGVRSNLTDLLKKQSFLQIMKPNADLTKPAASFWTIEGDAADTSEPVIVKWKGLTGTAFTLSMVTSAITTGPKCDSQDKRDNNPKDCYKIDDPGLVSYSFSGALEDFSSQPVPLAVRHWDSDSSKYNDNIGGTSVHILWDGCVFYNGERLQYVITNDVPTEEQWQDVPPSALEKGEIMTSEGEGTIHFRIQPVTPPNSLSEDEKVRYTNPSYRYGQYYLNVVKVDDSGLIQQGGHIKKLVDSVRNTLQGDPRTGSEGVMQKLFTSLVSESSLIAAIRAMLVLFVAVTGLGYIMGTIQMSQAEVIKRLMKIGVLVTLISPGAWEFFSIYLFNIFLDGGLELIAYVVVGSIGTALPLETVSADPTLVFSIFDGPLIVLFGKSVWVKIWALLTRWSLSVVLGLIIIWTACYYLLSVAKITMMFLMSMVIIALLLFAAPFFIACSLFSITQNFFNNWWKFLISFTLQPVALFAVVAIFNLLIMLVLQSTLSFTVCPDCLFKLSFLNKCIIPGYAIISTMHYPGDSLSSFIIPIGLLENVLILFILTHAMYEFCDFVASITNMIVSGQMVNYTSLERYGNALLDTGKWVVGQDNDSQMRRRRGKGGKAS